MYGVSQIDICEDVAVITLGNMPLDPALAADFFEQLGRAGIIIDMVSQASPVGERVSLAFTCLDADLRGVLDMTKQLSQAHPGISSMVSAGNVKVQLFGEEMRRQSGVFARALRALAGAGAEPQLVTTSEVDISLLLPAACLPEVQTALQKAFNI